MKFPSGSERTLTNDVARSAIGAEHVLLGTQRLTQASQQRSSWGHPDHGVVFGRLEAFSESLRREILQAGR